jgi:hypothetical protein
LTSRCRPMDWHPCLYSFNDCLISSITLFIRSVCNHCVIDDSVNDQLVSWLTQIEKDDHHPTGNFYSSLWTNTSVNQENLLFHPEHGSLWWHTEDSFHIQSLHNWMTWDSVSFICVNQSQQWERMEMHILEVRGTLAINAQFLWSMRTIPPKYGSNKAVFTRLKDCLYPSSSAVTEDPRVILQLERLLRVISRIDCSSMTVVSSTIIIRTGDERLLGRTNNVHKVSCEVNQAYCSKIPEILLGLHIRRCC